MRVVETVIGDSLAGGRRWNELEIDAERLAPLRLVERVVDGRDAGSGGVQRLQQFARIRHLPHHHLARISPQHDDILPIARQFLAAAAKRFGKKGPSLSPEAANLLLRYTWPGNVRELENALERALALARSDRIGVDDLPPELGAAPPTVQTADDVRTLAEVERDYIAAALRGSGGNRAKAAEKLGIGAATLYRKLKQARP